MYKAVFLDWDDTIGDFHGSALRSLSEIYEHFGLQRYFSSFDEYMTLYVPHNIELWEQYGRSEVTKEFLQRDRFEYPFYTKGLSKPALARQTGDAFIRLTSDNYRLLPHAREVIAELSKRYPLTVITNGFVELQYKKIDANGMRSFFRHIVLSEEVGMQKPDPDIFRYALSLNGVAADEAVMVGDSYSSDIQGAINAGIDQIWLSTTHDDRPATHKITDIRELLELLSNA